MRKKAKWLLSMILTVAMVVGCLPVSAAAAYTPTSRDVNPYNINIDVSGVPQLVQESVAKLMAEGVEPVTKKVDWALSNAVEQASGISLEAVKTFLGFGLMRGTVGTIDTSRFHLTQEQFDKVMAAVKSDYYLSGVTYECEVTDGEVTSITFMPESEAGQAAVANAAVTYADGDADSEGSSEDSSPYTAEFNWVRADKYVAPTDDEKAAGAFETLPDGTEVAFTLVYNEETKEVQYGLKTTIDYELESVTLTPKNGGEPIEVIPTDENCTVTPMYSFYGYELPTRDTVTSTFGEGTGEMASEIKYYQVVYNEKTYGDGPNSEKGVNALGRLDTTSKAMEIHWNLMQTFTRDYAQYFGVAGDFWTSKNTDQTPYGAFKTQLDSYPEDYIPDATMDYYAENMTLAYMSYVMQYASLLDDKINDCMDQITEGMTDIQKFLVIHDWLANNAQFDMGVLVKTMNGEGNPTPDQMTAFGALLSDAMGTDGCICLGYSAAFAVLVQHAFPEIYRNKNDDDSWGTWKTPDKVENDVVDLVQIRFYVDLAEISVAGDKCGLGDPNSMFSSVHYFNAVRPRDSQNWYYIDSAYDDISTEVMDQSRVETSGNISHKYFMISPTNMLDMFEDSMDYIDSLYDGVVFSRTVNEAGTGYVTEQDKYGNDHVVWTRDNTDSEIESDDDQYEATWFSGATSEITNDGKYWYYVTGPSFSYSSMMEIQDQMEDLGIDIGNMFDSDDPEYADKLVRRPMTAPDKPDDTEDSNTSSSSSGISSLVGFETYDDPYDEVLFHYGYGSVVPDEDSEENGLYYAQVEIDNTYHDMYPDLAHTMGLYENVIYFNLGNKVYMMTGVDNTKETLEPSDVTVTQLKEYNDVDAYSDGRAFTGMSYYTDASVADDVSFHVFNRPIAAISIEDKAVYDPVMQGDQVVGLQRNGSTTTMTVSIATNFSQSNRIKEGDTEVGYKLEAVDYNVDYSRYTDDGTDEDVNKNDEFMWCANVVDTMPMAEMLADKESGATAEVTVDAWCGQDGYTEQRTNTYGLSDGSTKQVKEDDPALNHHYVERNDQDGCLVCVHCNDAYHDLPEDDENHEELPEGATIGHYADENSEVVAESVQWNDDYTECTAVLKCAEHHCDGEAEVKCDVTSNVEAVPQDDGTTKYSKTITASFKGKEIDTQKFEVDVLPGDVTGDGVVDQLDVTRLRRKIANPNDNSIYIIDVAADYNGDGEVDVLDVTKLRVAIANQH